MGEALHSSVGTLIREWRGTRRLSQLELALEADISTRHLSFVETGRSMPSREMVLLLADRLDVPLRARNQLLLAGGYAPVYPESALDSAPMSVVRAALRRLLAGHDPYPAAVVDRFWNLVDSNESAAILTAGVSAELLTPPANVLRITLHPEGLAPRIVNFGETRSHLLGRLRRQVSVSNDAGLAELYAELAGYPCGDHVPEVEVPGPGDVVIPLRLRFEGHQLSFLSTIATFGTPLDVTAAELIIESFYPADDLTAQVLRQRPATQLPETGNDTAATH
ncbi:MAG: helix-turn-helix transcriptional regulator [Mycobacteriales bacterium]